MACRRVAASLVASAWRRHDLSRLARSGKEATFAQSRTFIAFPRTFSPGLLQPCSLDQQQVRWKKKKSAAKRSDDLDSDDDEETESLKELEKESGSKVHKVVVSSLRADLILKGCLGTARNKIEAMFYEGKIVVNDEKMRKKSDSLRVGDVIDVVQGPSPDNPEKFNLVTRIEILGAHEKDSERLTLHYSKQGKLLVPK
ncbi:mitochondrial transcription rescue factor 1 [Neocloeon triangulifer]|uniref:mitochondrial transcription rescue factor 1 n=1 Tax=Neocloeon triangulifer TaxID=2078957 RepID=UPI00286F3556|nr:mitochondrial transcription rescue factor 1 [Neocloeon triangulifer]